MKNKSRWHPLNELKAAEPYSDLNPGIRIDVDIEVRYKADLDQLRVLMTENEFILMHEYDEKRGWKLPTREWRKEDQ